MGSKNSTTEIIVSHIICKYPRCGNCRISSSNYCKNHTCPKCLGKKSEHTVLCDEHSIFVEPGGCHHLNDDNSFCQNRSFISLSGNVWPDWCKFCLNHICDKCGDEANGNSSDCGKHFELMKIKTDDNVKHD